MALLLRKKRIPLLERISAEKVDFDEGIIYGVKILGFRSENGREYSPEAVKNAKPIYEGKLVNIDHPEKKAKDPRSAYDRFGKFRNVRFLEGKGLYGDLYILKTHPMAKRVLEAAVKMPDLYGMSHNADGEGVTREKDGVFVVHKITEVRHVDLVADAATTRSLFEGVQKMSKKTVKGKDRHATAKRTLKEEAVKAKEEALVEDDAEQDAALADDMKPKILEILSSDGTDDEKCDSLLELFAAADEVDDEADAAMEGDDEDEDKETSESDDEDEDEERKGPKMEHKNPRSLAAKIRALEAEVAKSKTEVRVRELCESVNLNPSKDLVADLMAMPKEVAERHAKRLALASKAGKPKAGAFLEGKGSEDHIPKGLDLGSYLVG